MLGPSQNKIKKQLNPTKPNGCHIEVTQPCTFDTFTNYGTQWYSLESTNNSTFVYCPMQNKTTTILLPQHVYSSIATCFLAPDHVVS